MRTTPAIVVACLGLVCGRAAAQEDPGAVLADHPPRVAVERLTAMMDDAASPNDVRFALGTAQTLAAVEALGRDLHALGPRTDLVGFLPMLRLPVPPNDNPPRVTADDVGRVIESFAGALDEARATLEAIDGPVNVPVRVGSIGFDFDGDGQSGERERLLSILRELDMVSVLARVERPPYPEELRGELDDEERERLMREYRLAVQQAEEEAGRRTEELRRNEAELTVDFDDADVQWLIAYTHLLGGFADAMLAHDPTRWFEHCGHLMFQNAEQPFDFLGPRTPDLDANTIGDFAAALHLARFPVRDAERLAGAREHWLAAARGSREMFRLAREETDDRREWIPNGGQSAAFPNVEVTPEIIDAWLLFVDDVEGVLEGERLIPFWRSTADRRASRGVNLRRVFEEQRELDAILWLQGTAAAPYLEEGKPVMTAESFERLQDVTNGNFFTFAAWFN